MATRGRKRTGRRLLHCSDCGKSFGRKARLEKHQQFHKLKPKEKEKEKPTCQHCNEAFANRRDLKRHMEKSHPEPSRSNKEFQSNRDPINPTSARQPAIKQSQQGSGALSGLQTTVLDSQAVEISENMEWIPKQQKGKKDPGRTGYLPCSAPPLAASHLVHGPVQEPSSSCTVEGYEPPPRSNPSRSGPSNNIAPENLLRPQPGYPNSVPESFESNQPSSNAAQTWQLGLDQPGGNGYATWAQPGLEPIGSQLARPPRLREAVRIWRAWTNQQSVNGELGDAFRTREAWTNLQSVNGYGTLDQNLWAFSQLGNAAQDR
ncbi:MAG: hypothetical protein M1840_003366 [Geoglossum simile]|nr:MAG: hypothetical protein M1840_003366 [Geoglossum simile]